MQIQNRFLSEKWPISQKKWSVCENCEYKMPFSELFLEKNDFDLDLFSKWSILTMYIYPIKFIFWG